MKRVYLGLAPAVAIAVSFIAVTARAGDNEANRYVVTNLTSDIPGVAANTDPVLQNAWGVAFSPAASPFWVSDNATGCSTLYDGQGVPQPSTPLKVKIPLPGKQVVPATDCEHFTPPAANAVNPPPTPAAPTGVVWNPTTTFL